MQLFLGQNTYILTNEGIDCSLPIQGNNQNVCAWYVNPPKIESVSENGWVGSVQDGGSVNFRNILFNPHGHGTHTECLGHITETIYSVNKVEFKLLYKSLVITVTPEERILENGEIDRVVSRACIPDFSKEEGIDALLFRTLPNTEAKKSMNYSDSNPVYFDVDIIPLLNEWQIIHLLVDTPSVDREKDGGELAFHHAFWGVPDNHRFDRTITELIYLPDEVSDGFYMLNLQTAAFENDATPSRPLLFPIHTYEEE